MVKILREKIKTNSGKCSLLFYMRIYIFSTDKNTTFLKENKKTK